MIKNFRFGVVWRVGLLFGTIFLWVYLFDQTNYYMSIVILAMIIIAQVMQLIRYVEQTNKKLTRFLESIRYSDFSRSFPDHGLGKSFTDLNEAFTKVMEDFREERAKKQETLRYLETVVQHIGIGLICFNNKGEVELLNTAAKRLFDLPALRHINALATLDEKLVKTLKGLKGGNRTLVRTTINNKTLQLAISATEFRMHGDRYKLVSLQNIHSELEAKEMEAWQNLTQVLAHEIMNSITPIASLSDTVHMLVANNTQPQNDQYVMEQETLTDVKDALNTINKRSHGLMRFVNSYRDFTQIPEPDITLFSIQELLQRVRHLNKGEAEAQNVTLDIDVDPNSLEVSADPELIEQALINLVKNAFRVLEETEDAEVLLKGRLDSDGRVLIEVQDNGPGIKEENLEKIFIPFYSTSQPTAHGGSGIGLSLSRQIMRMHRGTLTVQSEENEGTTFTMRF